MPPFAPQDPFLIHPTGTEEETEGGEKVASLRERKGGGDGKGDRGLSFLKVSRFPLLARGGGGGGGGGGGEGGVGAPLRLSSTMSPRGAKERKRGREIGRLRHSPVFRERIFGFYVPFFCCESNSGTACHLPRRW